MRRSRWPGAWVCSAATHAAFFLLLSLFGVQSVTAPQDEIIEVALADDIFAPGDPGGGGGGDLGDSEEVAPEEEAAEEEAAADELEESVVTEETKQLQSEKPRPPKRALRHPVPAKKVSGVKAGGGSGAGTGSGTGTGSGSGTSSGSGSDSGNGSGSGAISRPGILAQVEPEYPERARRANVEGTVLLRVQILENGRAGDVAVAASSGSDVLDASALRAVRKWRFIPAKNGNGVPIACYTQIPIVFRLRTAQAD